MLTAVPGFCGVLAGGGVVTADRGQGCRPRGAAALRSLILGVVGKRWSRCSASRSLSGCGGLPDCADRRCS